MTLNCKSKSNDIKMPISKCALKDDHATFFSPVTFN